MSRSSVLVAYSSAVVPLFHRSKMSYFWSLAFLAVVPVVTAFGSGAPTGACVSLTPGHRASDQTTISPQTGPSPYNIIVNKNNYTSSEMLTVSVTGQSFQGILLQARLSDNTVIGTFSNPPANTQLRECSNEDDSITHANPNEKSSGTSFTWNAPNNDVGNITFTATVLQEYAVFWVGLISQEISYSGAPCVSINPGLVFTLSLLCAIFVVTKQ